MTLGLTERERRFVAVAVGRKRLFLGLAVGGVGVAVGLAGWVGYRWVSEPGVSLGLRPVVVLLILVVSRLNLRQFRYAGALEKLVARDRAAQGGLW